MTSWISTSKADLMVLLQFKHDFSMWFAVKLLKMVSVFALLRREGGENMGP